MHSTSSPPLEVKRFASRLCRAYRSTLNAGGFHLALAALIAAYHESGEPGSLRATLPLAGRTVVERQAKLAASTGANPVVIIVERIPAALSAALDRLRHDRVPLVVARNAEEAAEAIDPFDRLLLIADGAVADTELIGRIAAEEGETVLTVPDGSFGEVYERIDAASRWAGLAMISGAQLRETAGMLRDWDLQSTLLRRTLQGGARHIGADGPIAIIDSQLDLADLERRILAGASMTGGAWSGVILGPIERAITALTMSAPISSQLLGLGSALFTGLAAAAFLYGWFWIGLFKLLLAAPLEGAALRLAKLRMQDDVRHSWWSNLIPLLAAAALVAMGYALRETQGWGMVLMAFTTIAFLVALRNECAAKPVRGQALLAERRGMSWLMVPFGLVGMWQAALAFLLVYSAGSFFWAQRDVHASRPTTQD